MKAIRIDNFVISEPIADILARLRLISSSGKLRDIQEKSEEIVVTCPNDEHSGGCEEHPDCHINLSDSGKVGYGVFHCFACDLRGDFVDFVAHFFGSSRDYAKGWLISNYGKQIEPSVLLGDDIQIGRKERHKVLDESILDEYQTWTPYLAKRKLNREVCENFKVRYDPKYRQVIFPVYDVSGRLRMLAKRSIDTKTFYLDRDQEKEIYGLNIIKKNGLSACLVTEGPFDMLSSWAHGIPAVATLGTVSDYQIEQLNKSCLTTLYLAFDNDESGRKFARTVKEKLTPRILTVDVELPKGKKDLNDLTDEDWNRLAEKYF